MATAARAPMPESALPLLRFDAVSKRYPGGHEALSGLSFDLERGEMVFVTGHSGAGKSTLLRLVHRAERASRGAVLFEGRNLGQLSAREVPYTRRCIGMVFQDHRLLLDRSLFDNVALPLLIAGVARAEIERRVRAALERVGLLAEDIMQLFSELPAQGTAVLVASHDLHLVRRLGKRVLVLDHGRLADDFRPQVRA